MESRLATIIAFYKWLYYVISASAGLLHSRESAAYEIARLSSFPLHRISSESSKPSISLFLGLDWPSTLPSASKSHYSPGFLESCFAAALVVAVDFASVMLAKLIFTDNGVHCANLRVFDWCAGGIL